MKTSVLLSALLSFGVLGLAAGFAAGKFTQDARATGGSVSASDLARLDERMAALEGQLETLRGLSSDVEALKRRGEPLESAAELVPASGTPEEEAAPVVLRKEGEVPTKLEKWLEGQGMRVEFDDLVSRVYEQARNSRLARERAEQEERAREMEALSEGPYGKFNYRVNSLAKKLSLDAKQQEYLYNLLLKYDERRSQEMEQIGQLEGEMTPDRMKEHAQQTMLVHQQLNEQFESDLLAGLNQEQKEAYQDLPEHERGSGGFDKLSLITTYEAGMAGMKAGIRFAVPATSVQKPVQLPIPAPPQKK